MSNLTKMQRNAMIEFQQVIARRECMGTRRIVSMQALEEAGLVKRVLVNGLIADWTITEAGKAWKP